MPQGPSDVACFPHPADRARLRNATGFTNDEGIADWRPAPIALVWCTGSTDGFAAQVISERSHHTTSLHVMNLS